MYDSYDMDGICDFYDKYGIADMTFMTVMALCNLCRLCHCLCYAIAANAIDASWVVYVMQLQLCNYGSYGFAVVAFMYDIAVMVFVAVTALQLRKL